MKITRHGAPCSRFTTVSGEYSPGIPEMVKRTSESPVALTK